MTDRFKTFLPFVFKHECVFAKGHWGDYNYVIAEEVEGDAGGITKWGCDFREFSKKPFNLSVDDIRNLTMQGATDLYWRNWQIYHVEDKKYSLGEVWFNCKIVSGAHQADLILARTNNDAGKFILDQKRVNKLIVQAHPVDIKFLSGWDNRLDDLASFVHLPLS
jgi:lysozyme family protein